MWIYYTAITTTHGGSLPVKEVTIARASWRIDGWVSLEAGSAGGFVDTVPVARSDGSTRMPPAVTCRLRCDGNGAGFPGYGASNCLSVHGDHPRTAVRWRDRKPGAGAHRAPVPPAQRQDLQLVGRMMSSGRCRRSPI